MSGVLQWARSLSKGSWRRDSSDDDAYETLPLASSPYNDDNSGTPGTPRDGSSSGASRFLPRAPSFEQMTPRWLRTKAKPASRWVTFLLPFFIAYPLGLTERRLPPAGSTSYLNGVRGLACWVVLNHHLTAMAYDKWVGHPYGSVPWAMNNHVAQMPFVRVVNAGKGMVCVFFVLSGFVLSFSPLRRVNSTDKNDAKAGNDLLTSLSSSLLRRAIRLFVPLLVLMFITAFATYYAPGWWGVRDHEAPSFFVHLGDFWHSAAFKVMDPYVWRWRGEKKLPKHFQHAWTLGGEYRLSIVTFVVILFTCKLSTGYRKLFIIFAAIWGMYTDRRWDALCFLGGMFIAELRFAPLLDDFTRIFNRPKLELNRWLTRVLAISGVLLGLLFVSWPEADANGAEPYKSLWYLAPNEWRENTRTEISGSWVWYFGATGSIMLLWGLEHLKFPQRVLSSSLLLYAGEISYSFYLCQRLARIYIGGPLFDHFHRDLAWGYHKAFGMSYVITLVCLTIFSDYYWRTVDDFSVKLARAVVVDWLGVGKKPEAELPKQQPPREQPPPAGASSSVDQAAPMMEMAEARGPADQFVEERLTKPSEEPKLV